MSVILLCATEDEAKDYPGFDTCLVGNFRALEGLRISAAFATARATQHPEFATSAGIACSSVAAQIARTYSIPQVFMTGGGELPTELVRVA